MHYETEAFVKEWLKKKFGDLPISNMKYNIFLGAAEGALRRFREDGRLPNPNAFMGLPLAVVEHFRQPNDFSNQGDGTDPLD